MKKEKVLKILLEMHPRGRWSQAVASDAVDLVQDLDCSEIPNEWMELKRLLLNGATDWKAYSYGGCALVYNEDIARHYCTPSELRRVTHKDGTISDRANARENWLDVQARALYQAAQLVYGIVRK